MSGKNTKKLLMIAVLLISLFSFAACQSKNNESTGNGTGNTEEVSNTGSEEAGSNTPEDSQEAAEGEENNDIVEAWPRVISTVMGDVTIPSKPEKVVVNWYIGDVYSAGVKPVAAYGWMHKTMTFYEDLKDLPMIENWSAEAIMSYEPQVIVTYDQKDFEKFSKIAPVIVLEESLTPAERLECLGRVFGTETIAEQNNKKFDEKLAHGKEVLEGDKFAGKSFSILEDWGSGSYGIYYETGSRGGTLLYDYFNLELPDTLKELIKKTGEGRGGLSYEVAADYFGDYTIWFLQEDVESEYAKTEIYKSIPAVKEGHIIEIPGEMLGLFYYSDILSLTAQLDYLVDKLNQVGE